MPQRPSYLADHGLTLIDNGYQIVPIRPGTKAPQGDAWQKTRSTKGVHAKWLDGGYGTYGIGVLTEHCPALDIDSLRPALVKEVVDWCDENLGYAPIRVGKAPKTLLLFRTDDPFTKKFSSEWTDDPPQHDASGKMVVHRLEVLGKGQQFVAYAIHPDTKQPYAWTSELTPISCPSIDLPTLDAAGADAACAAFDRLAEKHGLVRMGRARGRPAPAASTADWTSDITSKTGLTAEKIRETLAQIPNEDDASVDFDTWLEVGMGVYHETDGSADGFDLWESWSERSHKHNHAEAERRWDSFAIEGKERKPTTFRFALMLANENRAAEQAAVLDQIKTDLAAVRTKADYKAAEHKVQHTELDPLDRASLKPALTDAYYRAYGTKMPIALANQRIRAAPAPTNQKPEWLAPFVYDESTSEFFHLETKQSLAVGAFNSNYNRHVMTAADRAAGKAKPEANASDWATNVYQIPTVAGVRYCPWEKPVFERNGKRYANSYSDALVPAVPTKLTHRQEQAVFIWQRHLKHMIIDDRERALFEDWLCYMVQTGRRCNWAAVMLGCQGDGKTWFFTLMEKVLGGPGNVSTVTAASIEDRFTPWAENAQLVVVEEVRIIGHSRYNIMNHLKPYITNHDIEIHRKNQTQYQTVNTAQYFMTTNHADALPVDDATNRYFVIRTRWQSRHDLKEFISKNPTYYAELNALPGAPDAVAAIRKHMLEKKPHPEFSPVMRAPDSEGKRYMAQMARDPEHGVLLDEIERGDDPLLCKTLVSTSHAQAFLQTESGMMLRADAVGRILRRAEFQSLGQVRVSPTGRLSLWSATPERFQKDRKTVAKRVTDYIHDNAGGEV